MSPLNQAVEWLRWQKNLLDYEARSRLTFSRPYEEPAEPKENLFEGLDSAAELQRMEADLRTRYHLAGVRAAASRQRYREVLGYLQMLEQFRQAAGFSLPAPEQPCYWLDVGAKNWAYVPALYHYLERGGRGAFRLDGIEADPYRRYTDTHSRADYARSFTRHYPRAHYHFTDLLGWSGDFSRPDPAFYHVISHFLPFVLSEPCLAWGLPRRFFQPSRHLEHLERLLLPGGVMLIVNQGAVERDAQSALLQRMVEKTRLVIEWKGEISPTFVPYRFPRYGWLLRKASG